MILNEMIPVFNCIHCEGNHLKRTEHFIKRKVKTYKLLEEGSKGFMRDT